MQNIRVVVQLFSNKKVHWGARMVMVRPPSDTYRAIEENVEQKVITSTLRRVHANSVVNLKRAT